MRKGFRGLMAAAAMVLGATAMTPPANAAEVLCGSPSYRYGTTGVKGCWETLSGSPTHRPKGEFWIVTPPGTYPEKWTACTLVVGTFVGTTKVAHAETSCLGAALTNGQTFLWGAALTPQSGQCTYSVASWYGTFDGGPVGSSTASWSIGVCP